MAVQGSRRAPEVFTMERLIGGAVQDRRAGPCLPRGGGTKCRLERVSRALLAPTNALIVENVPGAGSLIAANHGYNVAPKDGTTSARIQGGLFAQDLLGSQGMNTSLSQ